MTARALASLKENEAQTVKWPRRDREKFQVVLSLLYEHCGLVITRR